MHSESRSSHCIRKKENLKVCYYYMITMKCFHRQDPPEIKLGSQWPMNLNEFDTAALKCSEVEK